jgi:outer membrane protein OmpA-like peptidoglycan-associated protein
MKIQKLILVLALYPSLVFTQTLHFYFDSGKFTNPHHGKQLDSLMRTGVNVIKIEAYADYIGDSVKNERLSEKRAKTFLTQIITKQNQIPQIRTYGERFSTPIQNNLQGQPEYRKVTITYLPQGDLKLSELKIIDHKIELPFLEFVPGSHRVMAQSFSVLQQSAALLKSHPELKIRIDGHICCLDASQSDGYDYDTNEWNLSLNRAKTVYDYFCAAGISKHRMSYKGFGAQFPKVKPELTEEDRQRNRRVELQIID